MLWHEIIQIILVSAQHNYKVLIITLILGTLERRPYRNPYELSSDNSAGGLAFDKNNYFLCVPLYNTGAVYLFNLNQNVTALPPRFLLPKHQYKHYFLNIQKSVEAFDPDGRHPNDSLTVLS